MRCFRTSVLGGAGARGVASPFCAGAARGWRTQNSPAATVPSLHTNMLIISPGVGRLTLVFGLHTYAHTLWTLAAGVRCYTNNNNDMRMLPNNATVAIDCPSTHQVHFCSAARVRKLRTVRLCALLGERRWRTALQPRALIPIYLHL